MAVCNNYCVHVNKDISLAVEMCLMALCLLVRHHSWTPPIKSSKEAALWTTICLTTVFLIVGDINIICFLPLLAHLLSVCGPSSETPKTETSWEPHACWSTSMHVIPDTFLSLWQIMPFSPLSWQQQLLLQIHCCPSSWQLSYSRCSTDEKQPNIHTLSLFSPAFLLKALLCRER